MLNPDQAKLITFLYSRFWEKELKAERIWSNIDELMLMLEWLDDSEICRESEALYSIHKKKEMGCIYEHPPGSECLVYKVMEAVEAIIQLYKETKNLHPKNRYILAHYLSLTQDGQIISMEK